MLRNRTQAPPFLRLNTPWNGFSWHVELTITGSGYVTGVWVQATHRETDGSQSYGYARTPIEPGDDITLAIEACSIEASARAAAPPLPGMPPHEVATLSRDEVHGLTASRPGGRR